MQAAPSPARQARAHLRHDLRALTYVVLDEANGGIVRNLNHQGIAVQAVAALRAHQIVRVRFELRQPKMRVETQGEVIWAAVSGECGIRFLDFSPRTTRQINQWIFGSLLESIPQLSARNTSMFGGDVPGSGSAEEDDGLMVSATPQNVIQLVPQILPVPDFAEEDAPADSDEDVFSERDWLSRPLSGRTLAAMVDVLAVIAASLLFSLVFLSVAHELPKWPLNLAAALGTAVFVAAFYWGFFRLFAGSTLGVRLARLVGSEREVEDEENVDEGRFR